MIECGRAFEIREMAGAGDHFERAVPDCRVHRLRFRHRNNCVLVARHDQDRRVVEPDVTMQFMIAYSLQRPTTLAMRELVRILRMEVNRAVAEGRLMGRLWSEL